MIRFKTYNATGVAPDGRLYAGDLNQFQDLVAALSDFTQTHDVGTLRIGDSSIQLLKFGSAEGRITAALRVDGILRGLGGVIPPTMSTAVRNALTEAQRPYGILIVNTTTNRLEQNVGTAAVPVWIGVGAVEDNTISTAKIQANAVTEPKMADNSVGSAGVLADIPAFADRHIGFRYFATDQAVEYINTGAAWVRTGIPAGATMAWFKSGAAPTGWVKYDGTPLPSAVGIYADLAAHLGGTATPNTKRRVIIGQDSAYAPMDTIGETLGAETHTLTSGEMQHNHDISHDHNMGVPNQTVVVTFDNPSGSITVAHQSHTHDVTALSAYSLGVANNTATPHNNIQPSIVAVYIAKL